MYPGVLQGYIGGVHLPGHLEEQKKAEEAEKAEKAEGSVFTLFLLFSLFFGSFQGFNAERKAPFEPEILKFPAQKCRAR